MVVRAEQTIQNDLIYWVQQTYPNVIITATGNETQRKQRIGSIGIPDLILFHPNGAVLFLELKTTKGKLSQAQKDWNAAFDGAGFPHTRAVAYGYSEAQKIISDWVLTQHTN
jgi:hypothetical protein